MLSTKRPFTPRCAERSVGSRPLSSGLSGHRQSALMIVEESDDDFAASLKLAPLHQTDSNSKVKWKIIHSHYNLRVVDLVVQLRIQYFTSFTSFQEKISQILIMKFETHSSQMRRILETILSSSFQPRIFISIWKLVIWICREMQWPPPRENRVKHQDFS